MRLLALLLPMAVAACTFPEPSRGFTCDDITDCTGGRVCESGYCVVPGSGSTADAATDTAAPIDMPPDPRAACKTAPGYLFDATANLYYRMSTQNTSWPTARAACAADVPGKTHLLVISTQAEHTFMKGHLGSWVGIIDQDTEDVWESVTGEPGEPAIPGFWAGGQPDNGSNSEDCAQMKTANGLDDDQCNEGHAYVCECDGKPDNLVLN